MNYYLTVVNILPFGQGYTQTRQACVIGNQLPHAFRMRSVEYPVPAYYSNAKAFVSGRYFTPLSSFLTTPMLFALTSICRCEYHSSLWRYWWCV